MLATFRETHPVDANPKAWAGNISSFSIDNSEQQTCLPPPTASKASQKDEPPSVQDLNRQQSLSPCILTGNTWGSCSCWLLCVAPGTRVWKGRLLSPVSQSPQAVFSVGIQISKISFIFQKISSRNLSIYPE